MDREDGFAENEVMESMQQQGSVDQNVGFDQNLQERQHQVEAERRKREKKGYFFSGLMVGLASALLIICCVFLFTRLQQYMKYTKNQQQSQESATDQELTGQYNGTFLTTEVLEKIQIIEQLIKQSYYKDEDISAEDMEEGIYRGMISSLGDIYSDYYTTEELNALMEQTEGIYYGIGAGVSLDTVTTYPKIIKVYSGTPAEEAGLREDDIIYEVAGENTYGLDLTEVVSRIKGDEGTWVNLTIYREGESDYLSIDVQRCKVNIPTVDFKMLNDDMAYIQISEFDSITVDQFTEALAMAKGNNMKGLVLDLRSNPGGSLDAVVQIARKILPKGMIVYTEDKYGQRSEYTCDGANQIDVPVVVLINGNSASASEILAGAIKDYEIGTLVGTTTFGKGIVQSIIPLSDGSAVKVTISSYFTPNGNNIHGIGIEPDVECEFDGEAYYSDPARPDNQLDKAVEVLQELIEK